jgi:hypothetical protein
LTVPELVPFEPLVMVIHGTALDADQLQPLAVVTVTAPVPAAAVAAATVGATAKLQVMPACVTPNVWPAMVRFVEREEVEVFAATV